MTHSLHREGDRQKLERDFCMFIYPARGFNNKGVGPKVSRLFEIYYANAPSNCSSTSLRENLYSEVTPEQMLEAITKDADSARAYATFYDREKVKNALIQMKEANLGVSIMVSGMIDEVREIAKEAGLEPHTINLSLGIHGRTDRLPAADLRQFTTMCGHAVVAPQLVRQAIRRVKTGKRTPWEASLEMAKPCACAIFNVHRSEEQLRDMAPLYTVSRW